MHTLEKVQNLFMRFGIKSVTMDDIARELGISKKTLYQQFTDKNDMVKKIVHFNLSGQRSYCSAIHTTSLNPVDFMLNISEMLASNYARINPSLLFDLKKYHPEALSMIDVFKNEFIREQLARNLEEGKKGGWYRPEVNTEIITGLYLSMVDALLNSTYFPTEAYSYSTIMREQIIYHLHAITTEKGKKYLYHKLNQTP